jgi:hypothetical protein
MVQPPARTGCVHAPALQTSLVQEIPSSGHVAPSWFVQAVAFVTGWHHWHTFDGFAAPDA